MKKEIKEMRLTGDYYAGEYHIEMDGWSTGFTCSVCQTPGTKTDIRKNTVTEMKARLCKDCTRKYNLDHIEGKERKKGIAFLKIKGIL